MSSVQSIARAFDVLTALADGPLGVTEVAHRAGLPKSTTARLLGTLLAEGAVEQPPGDSRYRLGARMVTLAAGIRPTRSLVAIARPLLGELATTTGETAGLSVPDGREAHYVDQVDTPNPIAVRDWTGTRLPMHAVSSGQVFLAHLPAEALDAYLAQPLERFTPRTLVTPDALRERARTVALDGFAWARDEFIDGLSSVAAPVSVPGGEVVAAIHVHGPTYRFPAPDAEAEVVRRLVAASARLSSQLRG